ncbi:MAG: tryptophan synthase alpha chain, partial [Myxococcaceae bacterium]
VPNVCGPGGCIPRTCVTLGNLNCGLVSDGCGGTLSCGSCLPPELCGGTGMANVCGLAACLPRNCVGLGKNCGVIPDGCGSTAFCGTCPPDQACGAGGLPNVCAVRL